MKRSVAVLVLFCLAATACRSDKKRLEPETMKVVMWDLMKIDELYTRMAAQDTTLRNTKEFLRLYEEVYALHHITKKQFDDTYHYYESRPVEMKALLDSVDAYANRERMSLNSTPPPEK